MTGADAEHKYSSRPLKITNRSTAGISSSILFLRTSGKREETSTILTMSSPAARIYPLITRGGPEFASQVAEVIAAAFSSSALTAYLLRESDSSWPTDRIPAELLVPYFKKSILKRAEAGAELAEAGNFAAVAVW
jgi:hypothetical protein